MIKILSWNIRAGGGTRIAKICQALIRSKASIIALNEFRNNEAGIKIRQQLLRAGYRFQAVTHAARDTNSVLTVSKIPCDQLIYQHADPTYSANIVGTRYDAFLLVNVYLPHKKKHQLLPFLRQMSIDTVQPMIIAGDFNTGKNYIDQASNSFWYTDELDALEKSGLRDAFRHVNGDVQVYSWYSHQGNGYRYDHIYASEAILPVVRSCYYLHDWREIGLSDHSPMIVELG